MSGSIATGSLAEYSYVAESVFGSTPVGQPFKRIRDINLNVNLQKEIRQPDARLSSRVRQNLFHGYKSVSGDILGEISEQSWDDLLEAAIGGTWATAAPIASAFTASVDAANSRITCATAGYNLISNGFREGEIFYLTSPNGPVAGITGVYLTAVSVSSSTIKVEPGTLTFTSSSVAVNRVYEVGRKASLEGTYHSFTIERWLSDLNLYQQFRGIRVNQTTFSVPASGLATLSFNLIGRDASSFSSTSAIYAGIRVTESGDIRVGESGDFRITENYPPPDTEQTTPYTAINGTLFEGSNVLGVVTAAEISINNSMLAPQTVGSETVSNIFFGRFVEVTGQISVLFSSSSAFDKFIQETESKLILQLQNTQALDADTKFISIVIPRLKYSGGSIDTTSDSGVTVSLPFVALTPLAANPQQGTAPIYIQASNLVPRTQTFSFLTGVPSGWTYSRASNATYFNSSGVLTVASADVARVDYDPSGLSLRGLSLEPSRTNWVRNSIASAAVSGTPGTPPTTWQALVPSSVTRQIVGTGTEDGIEYIDIRYAGNGGESPFELVFDSGTHASAANGQVWVGSVFLKLVAGSFTGLGGTGPRVYEFPGVSQTTVDIRSTVTGAALRTQRVTVSRTNINAGTTFEQMRFLITPSATAWDFTLRFGLPQLELGNRITSPIKTSGATVTRAADRLTYSLSANAPWFQSPNGYTYSVEFLSASNSQGSGVVYAGTSGGSFSNTSYFTENFTYLINGVGDTGVSLTAQLRPAFTANKIGASINYAGARYSINGAALTASTFARAGYAAMTNVAVLSAPWGAGNYVIGWARSAILSNYFYSDSELRALTT
jgi:hypothetical protein